MAKPAQSRCHSSGRLLRLLAVRRARAANSKTSICALDHVAALPRLLSNDEAEALADCAACSSCLVSVLSMSSEWWRCVSGVLGTGSSRSPRRSGIRVAVKLPQECHRVAVSSAHSRAELQTRSTCSRATPTSGQPRGTRSAPQPQPRDATPAQTAPSLLRGLEAMAPTRRAAVGSPYCTRSFARKRDPEHGRCELSVKRNGLSSLVAFGAFGRGESAPACRAFPAIT